MIRPPVPASSRLIRLAPVLAAALIVAASALLAGPINPPPGPVVSTNKTLQEVEPRIAINLANTPGDADSTFRISQPGSYYLTGNLNVSNVKSGIEIAASNVTIDLMGFTLTGTSITLDGVRTSIACDNITIRNGTLLSFGGSGIDLSVGGSGSGHLIENVIASSNSNNGIKTANVGRVLDSFATNNTAAGIIVANSGRVERCISYFNSGLGIQAGASCVIANNIVSITGQDGILAAGQCEVSHNRCDNAGILALGLSAGIHATTGLNTIHNNDCSTCEIGVKVDGTRSIIARNSCNSNTTNWTIAVGNIIAPIVNGATNAAAVNGNTYTGNMGTTDPNANFSY